MTVLQIAGGFDYSKVYTKLFEQLNKYNTHFEVYVPQHKNMIGLNTKKNFPYRLYSNQIIKSYDKFIYYTKIFRMVKDVEKNFEIEKIEMSHAHSLFSDGAIAYQLYLKYKIPYIVTIRNTDVNKYFKYAFHLRNYAMNILKNAEKIVFISPAYKKNVFEKYISEKDKEELNRKVDIIPNGVDEYWLDVNQGEKLGINNKIKLIFVGRIDENKNLKAVIRAQQLLEHKGLENSLIIIGDGPERNLLEKKYKEKKNIVFQGFVNEKGKLKEFYADSHILIVPSFKETFGLVYVEAMACGLPVIYSKNQGIDGFFTPGEVGYAVDPNISEDILKSINKIVENYRNISKRCLHASAQFNWSNIAKNYIEIYKGIK